MCVLHLPRKHLVMQQVATPNSDVIYSCLPYLSSGQWRESVSRYTHDTQADKPGSLSMLYELQSLG